MVSLDVKKRRVFFTRQMTSKSLPAALEISTSHRALEEAIVRVCRQ